MEGLPSECEMKKRQYAVSIMLVMSELIGGIDGACNAAGDGGGPWYIVDASSTTSLLFIVVAPRKRVKLIIELGKCQEMEILKDALVGKMGWNGKGLGRGETLNAGFFVRHFTDWLVKLAVPVIWPVDRFKRDEFRRVQQKVRCMLFIVAFGVSRKLQFV